MKFLQVKLPDDLHWRFKRKCFEKQKTMTEMIKAKVEELLKED